MEAKPIEMPDVFQDLTAWSQSHPFVVQAHWYLRDIGFDFDVDGQIVAIHHLIERNRTVEAEANKEYRRVADDPNITGDYVGEYLGGLVYDSVFQDAAHSMAAVGMLAPFLETVFFQCFRGIGSKWSATHIPRGHERWEAAHAMQWDCHNVFNKGRCRTDLVQGILQLADAIDLRSRLPGDIEQTLTALFAYRNKMFHCGFEWPLEDRIEFQKRIDDSRWPTSWFTTATSGGKPWIFYMSNEFIDHCVKTAEQVLTAFGEFVRDDLRTRTTLGQEVTDAQ